MQALFNKYHSIKAISDLPAIVLIYLLFFWQRLESIALSVHLLFLACAVFSWYLVSRFSRLNSDRRFSRYSEEVVLILYHVLLFSIINSSFLFFFKLFRFYTPWNYAYFIACLTAGIIVIKYLIRKKLHSIINKNKIFEKILVISPADYADDLYGLLKQNEHFGYQCVGAVTHEKEKLNLCPFLGAPSQLGEILKTQSIDEAIISLPYYLEKDINDSIRTFNVHQVRVRIIPDINHFITNPLIIESLGTQAVYSQERLPLDEWGNQVIKRIFDIVFSLTVLLLIGLWLFPLIALILKLSSQGPILFKQERWGLNNKKITVYKFRTMRQGEREETFDSEGKFVQTLPNDYRITRIGNFLRKSSLDEFPQFINVLMGNMSVVGPRPHAIPHNLESLDKVANYPIRHIIKPGITGWAQVNGHRGATLTHEAMQHRVNHDLYYIRNWSFWLDCQIILQTVINFIRGDDKAY
ncbi:MAG: undecaprenyl-phosphate glucose phosphotransferase [Cyclobacteriaceae bacterium]